MYCSFCGAVAVAQGLSYCNHCGEKLRDVNGGNLTNSSDVKPELLVSAMVGLFIFGLIAIAVLIGVMKEVAAFDLPILIAVTLFSFLLMLSLESVLMWLLLRGKRGFNKTRNAKLLNEQKTKELGEGPARVLAEPISSVTEHTTTTFEPIYSERKTK